ncbi:MAG: hypothetical protein WAO83_07635 [Fuerstiella sp.]|jgi:hypothetical protein
MPKLPSKKAPPQELPTVPIALLLCIAFGGGFFGLLAVIFPGAGMMGLALLVLGLLFIAQYFVWGRWLYRVAVKMEAKKSGSDGSSTATGTTSE